MSRKRIAVLGGGVGAMSAVWALTSVPGAAADYDVHVYQMGWRLGGKGASGRNAKYGMRIEEHGLHIWAGFYENAFRVMRDCFAELQDDPTTFRSVEEAFHKDNNIVLGEWVGDTWKQWPLRPAMNDREPGMGPTDLSPWGYFRNIVRLLRETLDQTDDDHRMGLARLREDGNPGLTAELDARLSKAGKTARPSLHRLHGLLDLLPESFSGVQGPDQALLGHAVDDVQSEVKARLDAITADDGPDDTRRRLHEILDLGAAVLRGILADRVLLHGFQAIDHIDIIQWLRRHGATERSTNSAVVIAVYDYVFGFRNGRTADRNRAIAAGTFLSGSLRLALSYKGAIFYRMAAGMGDTIFTPLYKALLQRGVTFHFFEKVTALHLDAAGTAIGSIDLQGQATVKDGKPYDPLVIVKGKGCWPSEPLWDQLVEGEALQRKRLDADGIERSDPVNLESAWTDWAPEALRRTLVRGQDFDEVILGISLGALPMVAGELIAADPAWRRMVDRVKTTATQSLQLWLGRRLQNLGWELGPSIITAFADDLNTWADMTHLLEAEDWQGGELPEALSYSCGPLPDPKVMPPFSDLEFPGRAYEQVREYCKTWARANLEDLLPGLANQRGKIDVDQLIAYAGLDSAERWNAQYFRANFEPSERYVLSVPGSNAARLRADRSGFGNLWLAGDWTYTGINAGCVEAAVMSGMRAAAGLAGRPVEIVGEEPDPQPYDGPADAVAGPAPRVLTTFRPQNSAWPWSAVYGMAKLTGPCVVLPIAADAASAMLPKGLVLASQDLTPAGQHPVILLFGQQRQVRMNILPFGLTSYMEFICAVPYVRHGDAALHRSPMIWPQKLYLDSGPAIGLGVYGYGYPKERAAITADYESYIVRDPATKAEIIACSYLKRADKGRSFSFEPFARVRPAFEMAMITRRPVLGWQYSVYDFSLDSAQVEPLPMTIRIGANRFGLPPGVHVVPGIDSSPFGGFFLTADGAINNPLQSPNIARILAGER